MKGAAAFSVGFLTGAACALLIARLRKVLDDEEGFDELSDRISDHLNELEKRAEAAGQILGEA